MDILRKEFDELIGSPQLRELAEEIPTVGSGVTLHRLSREYILQRKLKPFISEIGKIPDEKRRQMIEQLDSDPKYRGRVGENLLLLLERQDSPEKPELLARAFTAFCAGSIDSVQFQRLCHAIDRVLIMDIGFLKEFCVGTTVDWDKIGIEVMQNFASAGLGFLPGMTMGPHIEPTETCRLFVKHILKEDLD